MRSMLYPADGAPREIKPAGGKFSLEEVQAYVGGYIELVCRFSDGSCLFANEDGQRLGLALNHRATELYRTRIASADVIVGPALLVAAGEID